MQERDIYDMIIKSANAVGWHLFRIADGSVGKKPGDIAGCSVNGIAVLIECKIFNIRPSRADINRPILSVFAPHQLVWAHRYAEANALALLAEYDVSRRELCIFMMTRPEHFEKNNTSRDAYPWFFRSPLNAVRWVYIEALRASSPSWYLSGSPIAHRESLQDKPSLLR